MGIILLLVLAFLLMGTLPIYAYSRPWGYRPSGILGLALGGLLILLLIGLIPWGFSRPAYYARPVQVINQPPVQVIEERPITVINPAPNSGQPVRIVPGRTELPSQ